MSSLEWTLIDHWCQLHYLEKASFSNKVIWPVCFSPIPQPEMSLLPLSGWHAVYMIMEQYIHYWESVTMSQNTDCGTACWLFAYSISAWRSPSMRAGDRSRFYAVLNSHAKSFFMCLLVQALWLFTAPQRNWAWAPPP